MALDDYALTTVSTMQSELGISGSTSTLERYIHAYSDLFREATDRPWHRDDSYTETIRSTGLGRLIVERRPVDSISKIEIDGDEVDSSDYEIEDADKGYIRKKTGASSFESTATGRRRVEGYQRGLEIIVDVTYDGGYATPVQVSNATFNSPEMPKSIENAVITSIVNRFRSQGAPTFRDSESIDGASISFTAGGSSGATVQGMSVSLEFAAAVKRHRDRNVI